MRIAILEGENTVKVTRASTVDAASKNKAQLECQRSLWKPGDVLMRDLTPNTATLVVRDWGLTGGVCRHQDTNARAIVVRVDQDVLVLAVTRGTTTTNQEWSRVR